MGSETTLDLIGYTDFETALRWHLRHNHYPPVPDAMYEPCVEAIDAGNEGDWDREVSLAGIATYQGRDTAPAWAIIEGHHLEFFITSEED